MYLRRLSSAGRPPSGQRKATNVGVVASVKEHWPQGAPVKGGVAPNYFSYGEVIEGGLNPQHPEIRVKFKLSDLSLSSISTRVFAGCTRVVRLKLNYVFVHSELRVERDLTDSPPNRTETHQPILSQRTIRHRSSMSPTSISDNRSAETGQGIVH